MLGDVVEIFPRIVRKSVKPSKYWDEGKRRIDHDWGSIFLMENCTVIRVYGCPQQPHFLPKVVPDRLGVLKFFWQLIPN